jgi:hypothetical protein
MGRSAQKKQEKAALRQEALQREFAQNAIQWKVKDAKAAGISPLYALGANTHSYAPVSVGGGGYTPDLGAMGQDIGRAIDATRSPGAKIDAYTKTVRDLSLQRMGLENELLSSQIAKVRQAGQPPGVPSDSTDYLITGQGNTVTSTPGLREEFKRSPARPGQPSAELGTVSDIGHVRTADGGYAVVPSEEAKQRLEDQLLPQIQWNIRNIISEWWNGTDHGAPVHMKKNLPKGKRLQYNPLTGKYYRTNDFRKWYR